MARLPAGLLHGMRTRHQVEVDRVVTGDGETEVTPFNRLGPWLPPATLEFVGAFRSQTNLTT